MQVISHIDDTSKYFSYFKDAWLSNRLTIRSSLNFSIWFYFRYKLTFSKETLKNSAVKFDNFPYNECNELHVN